MKPVKFNHKTLFSVLLMLAIIASMFIMAAPAMAGTGYSPITVYMGASSYTVTVDDWNSLLTSYTTTITGTYGTNNFSYTGVPMYRIMEFAFPAIASLSGYSVLTDDGTGYTVIYGPYVIDNTAVKGNNNLIIASSGSVNGVAATNLPRSACSTFTAGNRFNNNVAILKLQYAVQVPAPSHGTITPTSGWISGTRNPWGNSTPPAVAVDYNSSVTCNVTPASGYHTASILADSVSAPIAATYTFSNVVANHTLAATFSAVDLSISPASQAVNNGATFNVNLAINTSVASRGWQANIAFDASKLTANSVTEGGFLHDWAVSNNDSTTSAGGATIDNVGGTIAIPGYSITGTANLGGPIGTGTLCTISFTAKANVNNNATVTITSAVVSDVNAATIPGVTLTGGQVAIGLPYPDLVVSAASAAKGVDDSHYTITYTITNQGNVAATLPTVTSIVIDSGTPITVACPALAAGASDTQTTAVQTVSGASDTIVITADSTGLVTESNESNNSATVVYAKTGDSDTTIVNGNVAAKIEIKAPATIDPWNLVQGSNDTSGTLNVKCNSDWQVQVTDQNITTAGHMTKWILASGYDSGTKLAAPLTVGCLHTVDLSGSPQQIVNGDPSGQTDDIGQDCTISFHQPVQYADPVLTDGYSYHIVVTFTASVTF